LDQIDEVDYINLFLTSIGWISIILFESFSNSTPYSRGTQEVGVICQVCDSVRLELEKKDLKKYINPILTAYVVKTPADHEAGLSLLLRLRGKFNMEAHTTLLTHSLETVPSLVEDAVKYIIFLVDADSLFSLALGMYDFSLVLMIAQHAQKVRGWTWYDWGRSNMNSSQDPREYLPFLRELRALEKYYQRFKIDDHLKRHEKALWNLSLAGK
jgi:elongator complex protein 1